MAVNTMYKNKRSQLGYTLIELIVVVSITIMVLVGALALFFSTLSSGGKTASAEYTKQAGQFAMTQITFAIRNARKIVPNTAGQICAPSMTSITIEDQNGILTEISAANGRLALGGTNYLTPADLLLTGPTFSCQPASYGTGTWNGSPPSISITFSLQKGQASALPRDIVTIPFQSSVTMRNF